MFILYLIFIIQLLKMSLLYNQKQNVKTSDHLNFRYQCSVCLELLNNPHQDQCGHRLCLECYQRLLFKKYPNII